MTVNGRTLPLAVPQGTALGTLATRYDDSARKSMIPGGYRIECDGHHWLWLMPGVGYKISHDGHAWMVEGGEWGLVRLTCDGGPVTVLPTSYREQPLDPRETYVVVPDFEMWATWELFRWRG
ncbi:hypothetical protein [Longispora fulva]|uniref:Uncharacterized protein n=3 Tax=Longispora fulva TaxID=619741 RepID=A0A8J7KZC0_9ACTN|nr:hypothetical protein [Longispora fulva]MBG6140702.1 hypothetical protein [Longispora fulva]